MIVRTDIGGIVSALKWTSRCLRIAHVFVGTLNRVFPLQASRSAASSTMKTIGILGGSSDVATVEYYKIVNATVKARLGGRNTGEIVMVSMNFGEVDRIVNGDLWDEGTAYFREKAERIESARADFIICVSNTLHRIAEDALTRVKIPLLHIADPTAAAINAAGFTKIALLGTKPTMAASFMRDKYLNDWGIETLVPSEEDQDFINVVIFDELTQYQFKDESRKRYLSIVNGLRQQGAQGVILGCTEIGLLIRQSDCPDLPFFEPLRLHAEAAVTVALDEEPVSRSIARFKGVNIRN